MDDKAFQIEVLERLTAIETTLKQLDFKTLSEKVNNNDKRVSTLENRVVNNEKRIDKIEDNGKWLWRTVAGAIILGLLALIFNI